MSSHDPTRSYLTRHVLLRMVVKHITQAELHDLVCKMTFNPPEEYQHLVPLHEREAGHDDMFRYVLVP